MNENGNKELFNRMVKAGQRTYFVNVNESAKGNKYVTLTESKRVEKDKFERSRVMIFVDKLQELLAALQDAQAVAA